MVIKVYRRCWRPPSWIKDAIILCRECQPLLDALAMALVILILFAFLILI